MGGQVSDINGISSCHINVTAMLPRCHAAMLDISTKSGLKIARANQDRRSRTPCCRTAPVWLWTACPVRIVVVWVVVVVLVVVAVLVVLVGLSQAEQAGKKGR